jgi:hypothetical protein
MLTLLRIFVVLALLFPLSHPPTRAAFASVSSPRRVNAPYFVGDVPFGKTAIFWFGRVTPQQNYADVRVGYNDSELYVNVAVFDRRLWYDTTPSPADLTAWDATSLFLDLDGNTGDRPDANAYRFIAQLNWWEARGAWQAVYRGNNSTWVTATVPFTTTSGWRGDAPRNDVDDRGWVVTYHIPFASLGLGGAPPPGTTWGLGVILHDRDDASGTSIPDQAWPETMNPASPGTWGQLAFGLPTYAAPPATPGSIVTIRHGLNGALVPDGAAGGDTVCGDGLDYWTEWGEANYAGAGHANVQNQADVADWPCFSKYYVTFPLNALPAGKVIISATLTLHQFGNAGGGWTPPPEPSLIQVHTIKQDWAESTLNWNNAPLALENVSRAWVDPLPSFPGWPGVPRTWDVSGAVAAAYLAGTPLRLALYSADGAYHSGRYFVTSDTGDWNAVGRPTLQVSWGNPAPQRRQVALRPGWNLISIPLTTASTAITDVLASIAGRYDRAYTYNGCAPSNPWKIYSPTAPPYANDLATVQKTQGLWIRATGATTLTITGTLPVTTAIPLCAGWNLVGYPAASPAPLPAALASIAGKYDLVYAYDAGDLADPWKQFDPAALPAANDLTEMRPGVGYWIRATQGTTLIIMP